MVERLFNTEEVAWFKSCSAYQPAAAHILFLSHCVPNPPDKGEKIRAHHLLRHLCRRYQVHLACLTRDPADLAHARALESCCASVYAECLNPRKALAYAGVRFALGDSLTAAYYGSAGLGRYLKSLTVEFSATVAFSSAMAPYAPHDVPLFLDMVDVDSQKWFDYAAARFPAFLYRLEGRRLRALERQAALRARCTFLATCQEQRLLATFAPQASLCALENGVDFAYFNPQACAVPALLRDRDYVVFVGVMDYYPNVDACLWFADAVLEPLRRRHPRMEFFIVGRNPARAVRRLAGRPGVTVTGAVGDVRPYLAGARAVVAPLRIARGVQNKVLEALAMGKCVAASEAVCRTFGQPPTGISLCRTPQDYVDAILQADGCWRPQIRLHAQQRFDWERSFARLTQQIDLALGQDADHT